ncbi:MAG: phosphatase PAP2 family protein [Coriobacteriaceae bacterium]|nr:phosphatase PAP2 family protein [Coriobacteriaceae bacterium]
MDGAILLALQAIRIDGLNQIMVLISALGNQGLIWIVIAIILAIFPAKRACGILNLISLALVIIIVGVILDPIIARPHPSDLLNGVDGLSALTGVSASGYSFPSLCTAAAVASSTVMAFLLSRRTATIAFIFSFLIALARLYEGIQYPSDVLVGALVGFIIAVLVVQIYNHFFLNLLDRGTQGRHSLY